MRGFFWRGLYSEGKFAFQNRASHILGRKFPVFLCFALLYLRAISKYKPRGAYIWRGDLTEGFLRYQIGELTFEGAYHGGAHFRNFRVFSDLYLEDMQWSRLREGRLGR